MTRNQLQFHANKEIARHNRVVEQEDERYHRDSTAATRYTADSRSQWENRKIDETTRHNYAVETETHRSNRVNENIDAYNAQAGMINARSNALKASSEAVGTAFKAASSVAGWAI